MPSSGASWHRPRLVAPGVNVKTTPRRSCRVLSLTSNSSSAPPRPLSMCTLKSPARKVSIPGGGECSSSAVSTASLSSGG
eukprot:2933891-Heterocapsa_arctica.AAC.1